MSRVLAGARFYDLRGSVTTDLKDARVDLLLRKYFTGHSLDAEIMSRYETIKLHADMAAYFRHIQPLLNAIRARAQYLGIGIRIDVGLGAGTGRVVNKDLPKRRQPVRLG